jgi:NAD(P)H-hydrate epimerase
MSVARRGKHGRRSGGVTSTGLPAGDAPSYVFSRDALRELDRLAVAELRIPSLLLMEHASLGLARHVDDMAPEGTILIACGSGNNAGDGLALARHLFLAGRDVQVILSGEDASYSGDAGINLEMARRLGVPLTRANASSPDAAFHAAAADVGALGLVVDALLGTGLRGAPRGVIAALIHGVNALRAAGVQVLSVDIPSGLDADTGRPAGTDADVIVADRTVSFVGLKRGFLGVDAQRYVGDVVVEPIGTPVKLSDRLGERLLYAEHPGDEVEWSPHGPGGTTGSANGGRGGGGRRQHAEPGEDSSLHRGRSWPGGG